VGDGPAAAVPPAGEKEKPGPTAACPSRGQSANGPSTGFPVAGAARSFPVRAGIEPIVRFLEACAGVISSESAKTADAQLRAQELSSLTKIIAAWPRLSGEFRAAVLAVTASATTPHVMHRHSNP